MRSKISKLLILVKKGERTYVNTVIVVSELKTGEHSAYKSALSRSGFSNNAYKLVERR